MGRIVQPGTPRKTAEVRQRVWRLNEKCPVMPSVGPHERSLRTRTILVASESDQALDAQLTSNLGQA
jgi:hypothetical protein